MKMNIRIKESIHNAARSLREDQPRGHISDTALAKANMACAIRNGHEQAAAFWAEVANFCKARERLSPCMTIIIEPHPFG